VAALDDAGIPLQWAPILPDRQVAQLRAGHGRLGRLASRSVDYDAAVIHTVPECFPRWIAEERAAGKRVLGYTVWETERLPDHWPAILNQLDGVLVPCRWNVEVFRRSGVTVPIHLVPHFTDLASVRPSPEDDARLERRLGRAGEAHRFMFYTIGYWSNRKAPYLVLEAFLQAFGEGDPVSLVIKTSRHDVTRRRRGLMARLRGRFPSPADTANRLAASHPRRPPIATIATEDLGEGEMLALHTRGSCYVSLARTEGWGLGAFEAASLGRPVVMTGYGGQLDYLERDLSWLVDYGMVPVHEPTWRDSYRPRDQWAAPSIEQAARFMRQIYEQQADARARAEKLAARINTRFSRANIVAAFASALGGASP